MQVSGVDCKSVPGSRRCFGRYHCGLRHPPGDGSTAVRGNLRRKRTISRRWRHQLDLNIVWYLVRKDFCWTISLHIQLRFTLLSKYFLNNVCSSFVFIFVANFCLFSLLHTTQTQSSIHICMFLYILYSYQTTLTLTFAVVPMFQKRKTFTVNNISPVVKNSSPENLNPKLKRSRGGTTSEPSGSARPGTQLSTFSPDSAPCKSAAS